MVLVQITIASAPAARKATAAAASSGWRRPNRPVLQAFNLLKIDAVEHDFAECSPPRRAFTCSLMVR